MNAPRLPRSWYVLHTKSRFENVVHEGLVKKTLESFLPKITVPSRRKDRKKLIRVPLFPGYVFVRTNLDPREHIEIVKTVGAVKLVGNKDGPISVRDDAMDSLKIMVGGDQPIATGYQFKKGDRVMVNNGPFAGVIGIFDRYQGQGRVVVHIEALGQFAAVDVDIDDVEKLPDIVT